jgi:hypothetical protein
MLGLGALGCDAQADPAYQGEPLLTIDGRVEAALNVGNVEVGVLWLTPANEQVDDGVECLVELSDEVPSACVAACGVPSCDSITALGAWEECSSTCEGPSGVANIIVNVRGDDVFKGAVGQTTPVEGAFPAQFSLDILEPPPPQALATSSSGEQLAVGLFVALDPAGAPFELELDDLPDFPPWLLGGSGSHLLMFAPAGVPQDSEWGTLLERSLEPGFQLMEVTQAVQVSEDGDEEEVAEWLPVPAFEASEVRLQIADPATIDWPLTQF